LKNIIINTPNYQIDLLFIEQPNMFDDTDIQIFFYINEYNKFKKIFKPDYIYNKYTYLMIKSYKNNKISFDQLKELIF